MCAGEWHIIPETKQWNAHDVVAAPGVMAARF